MAVLKSRKGVSKKFIITKVSKRVKVSSSFNTNKTMYYTNHTLGSSFSLSRLNKYEFRGWSSFGNKLNVFDSKNRLYLFYESFL